MQKLKKKIIGKTHFRGFTFFLMLLMVLFCLPGSAKADTKGTLKVTFLDVGQGDSALLESDGKYMLIDGGTVASGSKTTAYLKKQGIKKLDYVVMTHDHADHLGGFIDVLSNIPVDQIIKTRVPYTDATSSKVMEIITKKDIAVSFPYAGETLNFGSAKITYVAPNSSGYTSYNDHSLVLRVVNGSNSFLFMGDAEFQSESEMIKQGYELKSDVLKVAHHSALTSSSDDFIKAVDPSISLISCDEKHKAGFPRFGTLKKISRSNIYRTDKSGNITMTSNGKEITVDAAAYSFAGSTIDDLARTVVGTDKKESFNLKNLRAVASEGEMTLNGVDADEDFDTLYTEELTINFLADYGISSLGKIEYALDKEDDIIDLKKIDWKPLEGTTLTIADDFAGCIYVKYTNKMGNTIVRKTNGFTIDAKAPDNCQVVSNVVGMSLVEANAPNTYSIFPEETVDLQFSAEYGNSGIGKTEYMLVERGTDFNPNDIWTEGNQVSIESNYIGRVYVKFTDGVGHETILKTTGITWISGTPVNTSVKSRFPEITFIGFSAKSPAPILVNSPVTLEFKADFGAGGKGSIQYQLVKDGEKYKGNGKWVKGSKVTIKKGFTGKVYVKFTDADGNTITRKTNDFKVQ